MQKLIVCVLLASCVWLAACSPVTPQSPVVQPPAGASSPPTVTLSAVTPKVTTPLLVAPAVAATPLFRPAIAGEPVPFEIVTQGDAVVGKRVSPFTAAMRTSDQRPTLLSELPPETRAVLDQAIANPGQPALYLVIYGGRQPTGGYAVKIASVRQENGKLMVLYRVEGPPPGQGAADVITYPYAIARVGSVAIDPAAVTFIEQKSAP